MKLTPREWLISIAIHAVVLGLLIWFIPARQIFVSATGKNPPPAAQPVAPDPTQVQEVVQAISQEQSGLARKHVDQLIDLEKKLDQMAKDRLDDYNKQAQTIAADAAQQALDQLKQIAPGQDTTLQAQDQLSKQLQALSPSGTNSTTDLPALKQERNQIDALQKTIEQDQVATQEEQEKASQLIHFLGQDSAASQAQQKANDAQNAAVLSQQNATKIQNQMFDNLNTQSRQSVVATREKDQITKIQAEIDAINADLASQQPALDAAKGASDVATTAYNQAHDFATADKQPADRAIENADRMTMRSAQQAYNQIKASQNRDSNKLKSLQTQLQGQESRSLLVTGTLATAQTQLAQLEAQLQATENASRNDQATAKQAQMDAIGQLTAMVAAPATPPSVPTAPAELATDKEIDSSALPGKNLGQLYETARQIENRIIDKYKVYRAAEFGSIQKLTLADALKATEVARPNRDELDPQLLSADGATKNFTAYKEEVLKARQQIQSMVDLSSNMVATAQAQEGVGRGDVKLQEGQYSSMAASALDDPNAVGKDLTQMTGTGKSSSATGQGQTANRQAQGEGNGANGLVKKPGGEEPDNEFGTQAGGVQEYPRNAPELPVMDYRNLKAYATRKISGNGPHYSDWLYVDSWYLIGPFPNERRENLYTKFAPESIIDLDAVYPGKNGRPLHWVFTQWNSPKLRPPNDDRDAPAIYYAYTELLFDQPEDLWIATGSDDKGTMWLNNIMVWNSNDVLKGWHPNEGYRKVHFTQGRNRILYRLENGQEDAAFSLMISAKAN